MGHRVFRNVAELLDIVHPTLSGGVLTDQGDGTFAFEPAMAAPPTTIYRFDTPSNLWAVTHNLGKYPTVVTVDSAGGVCYGDVAYVDANRLTIQFSVPFSGLAYID